MRKFLPEKIRRSRDDVRFIATFLEKELGLTVAGSWRRQTPTVGDLDVLVPPTLHYETILEFVKDELGYVEGRGGMTSQGWLPDFDEHGALLLNFWKVPEASNWAGMLLFATGPVDLNIRMRARAGGMGMMLSQYGMFRDGVQVDKNTEADIFRLLGLAYLRPTARQNFRDTLELIGASDTVPVLSSDGKSHYNVKVVNGAATACECRAFTFRGKCRHLTAAVNERNQDG